MRPGGESSFKTMINGFFEGSRRKLGDFCNQEVECFTNGKGLGEEGVLFDAERLSLLSSLLLIFKKKKSKVR